MTYETDRYWWLHVLCISRAASRNGDASYNKPAKEARQALAELRHQKYGHTHQKRPVVKAKPAAAIKAPKIGTAPKRAAGKGAILMDMLAAGTTLQAICDATGWQPHSAGARISGVKKAYVVLKEGENLKLGAAL